MRATLLTLLLVACSSDPCAGVNGTCVALHVQGQSLSVIDQLSLTLSGALSSGPKLTPPTPTKTSLPIDIALGFPAGSNGQVALDGTAFLDGKAVATGNLDFALANGAHANQTLTLHGGPIPDLSVPSDGAADAAPDLAGAPDLLSVDGAPDLHSPPPMVTLTVVNKSVAGATGVISDSSSLNCGSNCTATYVKGTVITLSTQPGAGWYFGGWTDACASNGLNATCMLTLSSDVQVTGAFTPANVAFTTSMAASIASLEALTGAASFDNAADAACATLAMNASLPGKFVAWLATASNSATARLQAANGSNVMPVGWIRKDGLPFLDRVGGGSPPPHVYYPLAISETGDAPPVQVVWTGAGEDGSVPIGLGVNNCQNWASSSSADSAVTGAATAGQFDWSAIQASPCDASLALYCFQVDYTAAVGKPPPQASAKLAFVTSSLFHPATGLVGADAVCDSEAIAAGLEPSAGSFRALIAPPGQTPASRFTPSGMVAYMRPDNVIVVDTDSNLFVSPSPSPIRAPIDIDAFGVPVVGRQILLGATSLTSTASDDCNGWTDGSGAYLGAIVDSARVDFGGGSATSCGNAASLICLQQ